MGSNDMRRVIDLLESIEWRGTADGGLEAQDTGHSYRDAQAYIKQHYPLTRSYMVRRAEPGFRSVLRGGNLDAGVLRRSIAQMADTDATVAQLGFRRNAMMSGSAQATYSIGWSWHLGENPSRGIAYLYYQDRGMGSDRITLAARDPAELAHMRQVFIDAGVIADLSRAAIDAKRYPLDQLDAEARLAELRKDGNNIRFISRPTPGERRAALEQDGRAVRFIKDPTPEERLAAIRQNGAAITMLRWPTAQEVWAASQQGYDIRGRRIGGRRKG